MSSIALALQSYFNEQRIVIVFDSAGVVEFSTQRFEELFGEIDAFEEFKALQLAHPEYVVQESKTSEHSIYEWIEKKVVGEVASAASDKREVTFTMELMEHEFHVDKRYEFPFVVLIFNVDQISEIDEKYGEGASDEMVEEIESIIKKTIRTSDIFGKYRKNFIIGMPKTNLIGAQKFVQKLESALLKQPYLVQGQQIMITMSGGMTNLKPNDTFNLFLDRAANAYVVASKEASNSLEIV